MTPDSQSRTGAHPVRTQGLDRERTDGNNPLLASLTEQTDHRHLGIQIKVVGAQGHGLGHARSRRVEQFQESTVPNPDHRVVRVGSVKEAAYLIDRQRFGEVTPLTRSVQVDSRINSHEALRERVLVEATDRSLGAGHRRSRRRAPRQLPRREPHRVVLYVTGTDLREATDASFLQITDVAQRVSPIAGNRVRRCPLLDAQVVHPFIHECFQRHHGARVTEKHEN